jgi:hypothetical protein
MELVKKAEVTEFTAFKDIEASLNELCKYGKPRLFSFGNNQWHCTLEAFVQGKGIDFKVSSEFNHPGFRSYQCLLFSVRKSIERLGGEGMNIHQP